MLNSIFNSNTNSQLTTQYGRINRAFSTLEGNSNQNKLWFDQEGYFNASLNGFYLSSENVVQSGQKGLSNRLSSFWALSNLNQMRMLQEGDRNLLRINGLYSDLNTLTVLQIGLRQQNYINVREALVNTYINKQAGQENVSIFTAMMSDVNAISAFQTEARIQLYNSCCVRIQTL